MKGWEKVEGDIESGPLGLFKWITIGVVALTCLGGGISTVLGQWIWLSKEL